MFAVELLTSFAGWECRVYGEDGTDALLVAAERGFKTKAEVLHRLQTMVAFLKNTAQHFHGVYPHWLDGSTGEVIPFSSNDNGADLVETAFLVQGLLCARQYFDGIRTSSHHIVL